MTISIHIAKADKTLSVDWDNMPEAAQRHIIEYGLRQKLNDAGSSATVKELGKERAGADAFAMAEVSLQALMEGRLRVVSARSSGDKALLKVLHALYKHVVKADADKSAEIDDLIEAISDKTGKPADAIRAAAQRKADEAQALAAQIAALKAAAPAIDLDL